MAIHWEIPDDRKAKSGQYLRHRRDLTGAEFLGFRHELGEGRGSEVSLPIFMSLKVIQFQTPSESPHIEIPFPKLSQN